MTSCTIIPRALFCRSRAPALIYARLFHARLSNQMKKSANCIRERMQYCGWISTHQREIEFLTSQCQQNEYQRREKKGILQARKFLCGTYCDVIFVKFIADIET